MTRQCTYREGIRMILLLLVIFISSVTIFAQDPPDIPDLIRVTVDHSDNGMLIQWNPSTDDDIESYHLYKMNPQGKFEKIIIFPANTFEYKHMISGLKNLSYSVTAMDSATNESWVNPNAHRAVSLSVEFDLCSRSNVLEWTSYVGWEDQISGYKIYGGNAGSSLEMLKFVHSSLTSFTHNSVDTDALYTYYIEAVHTSGITSSSAIDTIDTSLPEAPSYLNIDQVSVVDQAHAEIRFSADLAGPVTSFRVLRRSDPNTPYLEMESLWNIHENIQVFQDQFPTSSISYQYLVQSVFLPASCSTPLVISESNTANSILLVNNLESNIVTLNWTPYEIFTPGLKSYIVQRRNSSGEFSDIESLGPLTTQWQEEIISVTDSFVPGEVQYRVLALGSTGMDGFEGKSYSNVTAVAMETSIQIPNAFTPGSNDMNFEFKPQMDFAPRKYVLMVLDRGGRKLFETTDPGEGWDGRFHGGNFVDEGVYVYYIQFTDYTGLNKSYTGNLTVLYP